ncbi:hypothetical protein ACTU6V_12740 [Microbacterium sp. A204]|uniref:hypothetical protein n=1 Tax=Microbacterium sp. A204 TaxID=3457321 RepID=UPI003FD27005
MSARMAEFRATQRKLQRAREQFRERERRHELPELRRPITTDDELSELDDGRLL